MDLENFHEYIYVQIENPSFLIHIYTNSRNIYVQIEVEIKMIKKNPIRLFFSYMDEFMKPQK